MDNRELIKIDQIRAQIRGASIAGIGMIDMNNIDHVMLAAYLLAKTEADESHHIELISVIDLFGK